MSNNKRDGGIDLLGCIFAMMMIGFLIVAGVTIAKVVFLACYRILTS